MAGKGPTTVKLTEVVPNLAPVRRFAPTPSQKPYSITSLDFDDTGELCLVTQDDETLQIYNCKQGVWAKEMKSQKYGVDLARFSHHAQSIIYASTKVDDAIRYFSSHDNSFVRYFRGHKGPVTSIALDPSSDGFVSASTDNTVRMWDIRSSSYQGLLELNNALLAVYDPTATVMAVGCPSAQAVVMYDARNYDKAPFATFDMRDIENNLAAQHWSHRQQPPAGSVNNDWTKLEFSNDGQKLLVSTTGSGHYLLNAFDGHLIAYLSRPMGPTNRIPVAALSALREQQAQKTPGLPTSGQGDTCFSPDGRYVIGGSGDNSLYVWDTAGYAIDDNGGNQTPGPEKVVAPSEELVKNNKLVGASSVVGFNPRNNLLVTADKNLIFWTPDLD